MFVVTRVLSDNESKVFFEKVKGQYPEMDIKNTFPYGYGDVAI